MTHGVAVLPAWSLPDFGDDEPPFRERDFFDGDTNDLIDPLAHRKVYNRQAKGHVTSFLPPLTATSHAIALDEDDDQNTITKTPAVTLVDTTTV